MRTENPQRFDPAMRIDSYSFGVMQVDGSQYRADLIIFPDRVRPNWRRRQGHSLAIEDLDDVLDFSPEVLVIGKGASGMMHTPASTRKTLEEKGIQVLADNTPEASAVFNEQIERGRKVAGVFHLTC